MVSFSVYGIAKPAGSKRAFQHRHTGRIVVTDANKNSREWKNLVADAAVEAMLRPEPQSRTLSGRELLDGPLLLSLVFMMPRPKSHMGKNGLRPSAPRFPIVKPDLLKLARGVEDALTGIVYRDDAQIVSESLQKAYGEPARVVVHVEQLDGTMPDEFVCVVDESAGLAEETRCGGAEIRRGSDVKQSRQTLQSAWRSMSEEQLLRSAAEYERHPADTNLTACAHQIRAELERRSRDAF